MPQITQLLLRVKEADEADYEQSIIRIHEDNKPESINWGDDIDISLNKKNWVTGKLEPAGPIGTGKIYIGIHLRGRLNKDTIGIQTAQLEQPCSLYIRRKSSRKVLIYSILGIIFIAIIVLILYASGLRVV